MNILTVNLCFSTLVFWIAARIYVFPHLPTWTPQQVLTPILLLHALRHLGLMFLAPGAVYAGIPAAFTVPAALGDLLAALLALAALTARWSKALPPRGRWSGSSTSKARWICSTRSCLPRSRMLRR